MITVTINRNNGARSVENIKSDIKIDYSGLARHIASVLKEMQKLKIFREQVENKIGKVKNEEWDFASKDIAQNNVQAQITYYDETLVERLITSIDFFRRNKL